MRAARTPAASTGGTRRTAPARLRPARRHRRRRRAPRRAPAPPSPPAGPAPACGSCPPTSSRKPPPTPPSVPSPRVLRGEALLQQGNAAAAAQAVTTVGDDAPTDVLGARDRVRLLATLAGDPDAALTRAEELLRVHGEAPAHPGLRAAIAAVRAGTRRPGWEYGLASAASAAGQAGDVLAARWSAWLLVGDPHRRRPPRRGVQRRRRGRRRVRRWTSPTRGRPGSSPRNCGATRCAAKRSTRSSAAPVTSPTGPCRPSPAATPSPPPASPKPTAGSSPRPGPASTPSPAGRRRPDPSWTG